MHVKQTTAGLLACLIVSLGIGCDHTPRHAFCEAIEAPVAASMERSQGTLRDERSLASPRNFSWVIDGQLAGMAHPGYGTGLLGSYGYLAANEVTLMVSLTERTDLTASTPMASPKSPARRRLHSANAAAARRLRDDHGGRATQGGRVVVHCGAGQGRTGTFAAWFVASGATSDEAIDHDGSFVPDPSRPSSSLRSSPVRRYAPLERRF